MTALPPDANFTGPSVTETGFKAALTNMRAFLAGLLGTTGTTADALTALGALASSHGGAGGTAHSNAVASGSAGFMTGTDKAKLDGIATQANRTLVSIDGVDNAGGNVDLVAGSGITITPDNTAKTITITSSFTGVSAASIGQTELKTTTALHSASATINNTYTFLGASALAGGGYTLGVQCRRGSGSHGISDHGYQIGNVDAGASLSNIQTTTLSSKVSMWGRSGDGDNLPHGVVTEVVERYITASPPYNLGDGDTDAFVFLLVNADGSVRQSYIANDPPWAYNGPTRIFPTHMELDKKTGKLLRKLVRRVKTTVTQEEALADAKAMKTYLEQFRNPKYELVEPDAALKNADMALIPHPFGEVLPEGCSVVLVDPLETQTRDIVQMMQAGESPMSLFEHKAFKINNDPLPGRRKPKGVHLCKVRT